ncbi:MAG: aminotransferase class V-fold PLP-dependent enzyme, partial [Methanoregula sp.]|nr:aminotransferase class V-fold PLP-dependent enzyme [Methanoregula sp.]
MTERFGTVPLPKILLLNKTGGADRADLVIMHGERFGWLTFDPVLRKFSLDIAPEALPYILSHVRQGIVDLDSETDAGKEPGRIGGKKFALKTPVPDGTVIVKYKNRYGTGIVKDGSIRVKELISVIPQTPKNPEWEIAVEQNRYHLKNLERNAIRSIKQHIHDRPTANVSFSGGKDSTAVLHIARKAGVTSAFFIDTGIEFPETVEFVRSQGVEIIRKAGDFWQAVEKAGPPGKDHRWCCKLLKLHPLKLYLAGIGPCVTVQGNRWYESWNRADLDETSQNPANPLQLNISPIRNWRALEVFLYLWWQKVKINPLYDKGLERIGCFLCPAMLESEYEELRIILPEYARRWDAFLEKWADKKGLPGAYCTWGLWRWHALPPKMRELCKSKGIPLNDDFTLKAGPPRVPQGNVDTVGEKIMETLMETQSGTGFDVNRIRKDFPILGDITYLDNAATSFSPEPVIDAMVEFEHQYRANVGRGVHRFTRIAS